jgi:hypothetical protein
MISSSADAPKERNKIGAPEAAVTLIYSGPGEIIWSVLASTAEPASNSITTGL